ncbi:circadian locomoter output cycles kaput-like [Paramuricea clavata]|uniref:Circadian locomoter output cycles kaput-like n=1 Tax=Paramuricea clavata TaxID=317549 RepID=A0A6S7HGI8_PARCT|nr:circadian locomoter output cycles kaput-like [Paramuricea clavata]
MDDLVTASQNERAKDRRDKVNAFINELATLVPGCSPQQIKLDKAIVLKNTVDFIKVHKDLTVAITCKDTTPSLQNNEVRHLMFEGYNAFLFVISLSGTFKFLSECVYDLLGYKKGDLIEKNVLDYIHPEDKLILMRKLSEHSGTGIARISGSSLFYIRFKAKVHGKAVYDTLRCCGYFSPVKEGNLHDRFRPRLVVSVQNYKI